MNYLSDNYVSYLAHRAYNIRVSSLKMTTNAGSGHPTSCLSAADVVAAVFFHAMHADFSTINNPNNDRFILSKGHAAPVLYAAWKELGLLSEEDLLTYRALNSPLEGHPTPRCEFVEVATGSLGQGLSIALGMALEGRFDKRDFYVYCLMGDSEMSEGSVWEAIQLGAHYKLDHVIGIVDVNKLGQSTQTLYGHDLNRLAIIIESFGWQPLLVDGHNMYELVRIFDEAKKIREKPIMILAHTLKGYGVEKTESKQDFHGKAFSKEELPQLLATLKQRFLNAATYKGELFPVQKPREEILQPKQQQKKQYADPTFVRGDMLATRKAYGYALRELGACNDQVISLDAEVNNSTYANMFAEKFPERFVQCFIAEQNMVGMAVGLAARGKVPFVSTFGAFFSRAFDQIRMAAIGKSPLRLVGSHAGVSIGEDGPSQMGLEDIALMRTLPESSVFYPCDAVSTYKLVECMHAYTQGISYLRTTRMDTEIIYDNSESFYSGGCKVLRQSDRDEACIIVAGITVHEALKAYAILSQEGRAVSVIDLYSIKPFDFDTVLRVVKASGKRIITAEDHYLEGGLGEMIASSFVNEGFDIRTLAVMQLPRSGKPEELLRKVGIDAMALVNTVRVMLKQSAE